MLLSALVKKYELQEDTMRKSGQQKIKRMMAILLCGSLVLSGGIFQSTSNVYASEITENTEQSVSEAEAVSTEDETSENTENVQADVTEEATSQIQEKNVGTTIDGTVETTNLGNAIARTQISEAQLLQDSTGVYNVDNAFRLLSLINSERKNEGKSLLSMDKDMYSTARVRAVDIVTEFSHKRPDGDSCFSVFPKNQVNMSELLAQNSNNPVAVYEKWMSSPEHKEVMFSNKFTCVGIACYYDPSQPYKYYWALCFGDNLTTAVFQNGNDITTDAPAIYNGVDYSAVYNYNYYISRYADVKTTYKNDSEATLKHFVENGMKEGRQGCAAFNVNYYKNRYPDLRKLFGNNLVKYYMHYISYGLKEGRDGKTPCDTPVEEPDSEGTIAMYRLYNPNSGEHFYTADEGEKNYLVTVGWKDEKIAWYAPETGDPVYRLYNPNAGDHHYTMNEAERDNLVSVGWKYEGVAWRSGGNVPLYRAYNPNAKAGAHHYTVDTLEIDNLASYGWKKEGIAWYAIK